MRRAAGSNPAPVPPHSARSRVLHLLCQLSAAVILILVHCHPVQAQSPIQPGGYGGHSLTTGGVQLLGIEPLTQSGPRFSTTPQGWTAAPPIRQVQYPLDNSAYTDPFTPPPTGQPGYRGGTPAPAVAPPSCALPAAPPQPDAWVTLDQSRWEATWVAGGSDVDAVGLLTNEFRAKLKFPGARMLTLSPRFGWHFVDGPIATDLPSELYDASLEGVLSLPLSSRLFMQAAVAPSVFSDGRNSSRDGFRLPGRWLVFWNYSDRLTLSTGLVYLDRDDIGLLPAAGLIYKPTDDWRIELLIPRPRVAWRYASNGPKASWLYAVGEFGGGSWAIERASEVRDVATLSDYRLLLGWERIVEGGVDCRVEGGYVFNRSLEYQSLPGERDLPGTALVRFALSY